MTGRVVEGPDRWHLKFIDDEREILIFNEPYRLDEERLGYLVYLSDVTHDVAGNLVTDADKEAIRDALIADPPLGDMIPKII